MRVSSRSTGGRRNEEVGSCSAKVGSVAANLFETMITYKEIAFTAYAVTKAFWTQRAAMAKTNPYWGGVTPDMIGSLAGKLHPGAIKYYDEAKIGVPASAR